MNRAVIAVGSNIDPERNIAEARRRIVAAQRLLGESPVVETEPIGKADQPNFFNGTLCIETPMDREALRAWLHGIEQDLGRRRTGDKYGPRTIDLDIVVWNGEVVDDDVYRRDYLKAGVRQVWPGLVP